MNRDAIIAAVLAMPKEERGALILVLAQASGWHPLSVLDEASVRDDIRAILEIDSAFDGRCELTPDDVTDADILAACASIARHIDLAEELGAARYRAARAAIRLAETRQAES